MATGKLWPLAAGMVLFRGGCWPRHHDTGATSDSGPRVLPRVEAVPYVAEELCVNYYRACARLDDGAVACWGRDIDAFELDVNANRMRCGNRVCVEQEDSGITCFDWDGSLEAEDMYTPPDDMLPFSDWWDSRMWVVGGCGIRSDQHAACWPTTLGWDKTVSGFATRGIAFTLPCLILLDTDGEIHSLFQGENCAGHDPKTDYKDSTYGLDVPPAGNDWQSVSGGAYHACALDSTGKATCWGPPPKDTLQPDPHLRFTQLDSADFDTCGVTTDGHISCWAPNDLDLPTDVPTTGGWVQVGVGPDRGCALDENGQITCFGDWEPSWSTLQDALRAR